MVFALFDGQLVCSNVADQVVDAIGEDAVSDTAAGFYELLYVSVQLVNVGLPDDAVVKNVLLKLDAGVIDIQVHPSASFGSGSCLRGHV